MASAAAQVADGGRTKPTAAASPAQQTLPRRRRVRAGGEEREDGEILSADEGNEERRRMAPSCGIKEKHCRTFGSENIVSETKVNVRNREGISVVTPTVYIKSIAELKIEPLLVKERL